MPGTGHLLTELFAFVALHDDVDEGVVAGTMPNGSVMPLIAADRARMEALIPIAQSIANVSGFRITIAHLTVREDERVIEPEPVVIPGGNGR